MNYRNVLSIVFLLLFIGCELEKERVTVPESRDVKNEIKIAEKAAQDLMNQLGETLMKTVDVSGFANTVSICNYWAPVYSKRITDQYEEIRSIKRTSMKVRNNNNKPDKYEIEALAYFVEPLEEGVEKPEYYVQRVNSPTDSFLKYYKPIYIKELCLNCHGPQNLISPEVIHKIKSTYPDDAATGYFIDDFRGLISVTVNQLVETE